MTKEPKVLVTGAAGFIGFHLSKALCAKGFRVTGIDNLNPYYDVSLKESRLRILQSDPAFEFKKVDLGDVTGIKRAFDEGAFTYVVNLAAQAFSALMDGLWLAWCLNPDAFRPEDGVDMCRRWIEGLRRGAYG